MTLTDIETFLAHLSENERELLIERLKNIPPSHFLGEEDPSIFEKRSAGVSSNGQFLPLAFSELSQLIVCELKRQTITYEEMAIQIGISLSTFKRIIADPANAKANNLHALLTELGIKVWLDK
jgi:hypothetical protein